MTDKTKHSDSSQSVATKPITRVERHKDLDGTYEVTLVEQSRRKLTTKDELLPIIAQLASEAQRAVEMNGNLLIGEKDVYLAFARRFINYLEDAEDDLFSTFLKDTGKL